MSEQEEGVVEQSDTFEYAIRKDVRNNPIVREVDEERHRELWQSVGIGVVLVLVLLFSAWQHFELLRHGYRLEQMQRERAVRGRDQPAPAPRDRNPQRGPADREAGHAAAGHGRSRGADDAVILERVVPPPAPASTVVAAR